jgi:hypothetical protein
MKRPDCLKIRLQGSGSVRIGLVSLTRENIDKNCMAITQAKREDFNYSTFDIVPLVEGMAEGKRIVTIRFAWHFTDDTVDSKPTSQVIKYFRVYRISTL